jgi:Na+-transporting methylmalonyl-CoA/oxaloacetate decarboxylase gamma subunit
MEFAVWIIAVLLLLLLILAYFMYEDMNNVAKRLTNTMIWLEKIEKKLDDVEKVLRQQMDEARNRNIR